MTTIVTISPIIPVGPRISCRSFPRESQRTAAARSALSPPWIGRHAAQYSNRRDGSARQPEPSAVVPDESSALFAVFGSDIKALQIQVAADR